ncbi:MAG: hypothetical protein CL761_05225 [Chloroflexi bacterium]|nr:hypothetical protein [Chloroflexota bacterium]MBL40699.1 hypothetical protein [Chloroflexota bacterium]MCH2672944.1 DCC1-like thiol-disulfide oxidoreductase family protein [Dehalococcoidia bacterium]|tara:strand:- start:2129 stop:2488 length:360 start_codon:yes stop_codon:yes gene_type:complete
MTKIVFYDHNCKICTCFKNWVLERSSYWTFLPNDENSIIGSGMKIDLSTPSKKIVCEDERIYLGGIAILKILAHCNGKISFVSKILLSLKFLYFIYNLFYFLFSKNRSKFSFLIPYIGC